MLKSVLKEIFIILLLSVAILLILGILFYDYIPINRVVPQRQAYITPENVKEEIDETITESEKIEVTYEVTDSDLNIHKQESNYSEGKANPFALPEDKKENTSGNETQNDNNSDGTNDDSNGKNNNDNNDDNNSKNTEDNNQDTVDKNSTGTFWDDGGIK